MIRPDWLMKRKNSVNVIFISDIHFLNSRVSSFDLANRIIEMLQPVFIENEIDYLVIAGDIFDEAGYLPQDDFLHIHAWFATLLELARINNTKIRILEGTPSHDRKQSKHLAAINQNSSHATQVEVKYMDKITLLMEDDGSTWLYVPDEVHHDPEVVLELVKEKLHENGLSSVDFIVTHGMYNHHLKTGMFIPAHDADAYLALANLYIDNGHIHTSSVYKKRFITNGSADRLKQGEEEKKGAWHLEVSNKGVHGDRLTFIENKKATYIVTINLLDYTFEKALIAIEKHCHPTEKRYIRLDIGEELHANGIVRHFADKYPFIHWAKKIHRNKNKDSDELLVFKRVEDIKVINSETVSDLLRKEMQLVGILEEEITATLELLEKEAI